MKTLFAVFAFCVLMAGASAQVYQSQTVSVLPVTVPAATTTNLAASVVIDAKKQDTINVVIGYNLDDAGTNGPVSFVFAQSVDGSNFETLAAKQLTVSTTADGTNTVNTVTEFSMNGAGYLKLLSIANEDEAAVTNLVIKCGIKIGSP